MVETILTAERPTCSLISNYDAHVVDVPWSVRDRCVGADTRQAVAGYRPNFEGLAFKRCPAQKQSGVNHRKTETYLHFNGMVGWRKV
jgi:hypothetical protein